MNGFNCCVCGKFFKWDDSDNKVDYIPDSDRSKEVTSWTCGKCVRNGK